MEDSKSASTIIQPKAPKPRVGIIGTGNVASHIVRRLRHMASIVFVASRHVQRTKAMVMSVPGSVGVEINQLLPVDFVIVAVSDDAISEVAAKMGPIDTDTVVVHTSGSVPMSALAPCGAQIGVLYPLQTFTVGRSVSWRSVQILVEGMDPHTLSQVETLAAMLYPKEVTVTDDSQRAALHLAAVWACNFTNHMLAVAQRILQHRQMELSILRPLIEATITKALTMPPEYAQTGPAIRGDRTVLDAHVHALGGASSPLGFLYKAISNDINPAAWRPPQNDEQDCI